MAPSLLLAAWWALLRQMMTLGNRNEEIAAEYDIAAVLGEAVAAARALLA